MLLLRYYGSGNNSDAEEETRKECFMDKTPEDNSALQSEMLCEMFQSLYCPEISKEEHSDV